MIWKLRSRRTSDTIAMDSPPVYTLVRHRFRGDVLLCSAVVRGLALRHPTPPQIYIRTEYPECFAGNPYVTQAGPGVCGPREATVCNADLVLYEKMPGWHLIDSFAASAGFARGTCPRTTEMFLHTNDYIWADRFLLPPRYVVMSPGPGAWEGRNWKADRWETLIKHVREHIPVVLVGHGPQYKLEADLNLHNRTTRFGQLGAIIERATAFVGIDSFPCHVAGAIKTPRVVLFGVTSAANILCDAPNTIAIESAFDHPLTGMRHKVASMNRIDLGIPPNNPMDTISVKQVLSAVLSLI